VYKTSKLLNIEEGMCPYLANKLAKFQIFFVYLWSEIPKYSPIKLKFDMHRGPFV